jgi:hypothetical protein
MKLLYVLAILLPSVCLSQPSKTASLDLQQYIAAPKHHLTITKIFNGTELVVSYRPVDLLLSQDLQRYRKYDGHIVDSLRALYDGNIYFSLTLSKNGAEIENQYINDKIAYNDVIKYLNSGIGKQLSVKIDNHAAVPISGHAFVRMYGTTGKTHIVIVCKKDDILSSKTFDIILNDTQLGIGTSAFSFVTEHLKNIPTIQF